MMHKAGLNMNNLHNPRHPVTQDKQILTSGLTINTCLMVLAALACMAQLAIDFSTDNIASACIVLCSSIMTLLYLRWSDALVTHPLSTFAIFGFCITSQLGALLVQSACMTSLSHDLRQPLATFGYLAFFQAIAIAAHAIYRLMTAFQFTENSPVRTMLSRSGLYTEPPVDVLWIIGLIGILAILTAGGGAGNPDVGNKVSAGLSFLAWAPFLIPIYVQRKGPGYCKAKVHYFFLFIYVLLIALLGIASNARGMMFSGVVTIGLIALLEGMRSTRQVTSVQIAKIMILLAVGAALIVPLSDLATAMAIARSARTTATAAKMVDRTFYVLQQPHLIEAQRLREKVASHTSSYDESYIENPILARFVETKFHDNALYFASRLSPRAEDELLDTTIDLLWSTLPDPVLKAFDIPVKKAQLRFSMGDYLAHQSVGGPLGGYKTGSALAHGIGLFGLFFPFVYLAICILMFPLLDLLSSRLPSGQIVMSVVGMLTIWRLFLYGITAESLTSMIGFATRGFIQTVVLYLIVYQVSKWIAKYLPKLSWSPKNNPHVLHPAS